MAESSGNVTKKFLDFFNGLTFCLGVRIIVYGVAAIDDANGSGDFPGSLIAVGVILLVAALVSWTAASTGNRGLLIMLTVSESILVHLIMVLLVLIRTYGGGGPRQREESEAISIILGITAGVVVIRIGLTSFIASEIRA